MRRLRSLIAFLFLTYVSISQNYTSRLFSTDQGLPDAYVYSVVQDDQGFLWIATGKGLVKFDGQMFVNYDLHAEDNEDIVYSGVMDQHKDLWFGTFSGKIYTLDRSRNRLQLFSGHLNGSVNKIVASRKSKTLYLLSKGNGIYALQNKQLVLLEGTQNYQINAIDLLADDLLLAATSEGLFTIGLGGTITKVSGVEGDISQVQALQQKRNTCLISSGAAIFELTLDDSRNSVTVKKELNKNPGADVSVFCLNEADGQLYFGHKDETFAVINTRNGKLKRIDESDYLAIANGVFIDRESNIWVSTTGKGLYRLFKTEFDFINLNNAPVYCMAQDHDHNTLYGTKTGIIITNASGEIVRTIEQAGGKALGKVTALLFDGTRLWIGTGANGLMVVNARTFAPLPVEFSTIANIAINAINTNPYDDDVQVCTNLDGVYQYSGGKLKEHLSVQNNLLHNNVYAALKSKSGRVYYAMHNTAFNFSKGAQVYEIGTKAGGLISDFNAFAENKNGTIMIATNGDGLYMLSDTTIHTFPLNDRLESRFCNGLLYDNNNNLWILQRYGLYKYYTAENVIKKIHLNFDNRLLFNSNAMYKNKQGDLFFGTDKNVVVYDGTKQEDRRYLPQSYIVSVHLFDSVININPDQKFSHGKYSFTFDYSALCLKNSEEVSFRYMLEGRDDHWSEPTKARHVEFSNLSEGNYTFKVMAINSDGFQEKEPASISFNIDKPFWKKAGFWLVSGILLIVLVIGIVRWRTAALIREKLKLEQIVEEKTVEIRKEKEIVEENSKIIEAQHHEITQSINYARRIQEAILPVFTRQPEILVYFQPKDIVSGDFYWHAVKDSRFLIAACDCTGHGVPGAFMSLIGSTLLNKIVLDKGIVEPQVILSEIDREVSVSLKQESNEVRDGMETAVCSFDLKHNKLYYAGAKRPLWLFRKTTAGYQLEEFAANKFPIGGFADVKDKVFTAHEIDIAPGDTVYMFSDGIIDQFDHANKKRISTRRVREFLSSVVHLPLELQEKELSGFFDSWKQSTPQTDDVLVLGVRV